MSKKSENLTVTPSVKDLKPEDVDDFTSGR